MYDNKNKAIFFKLLTLISSSLATTGVSNSNVDICTSIVRIFFLTKSKSSSAASLSKIINEECILSKISAKQAATVLSVSSTEIMRTCSQF